MKRRDSITDWCIPLRGQPTVPTVTEQHGITGVAAVFHWQTAGPVQSTFSQGSGRHVSWTRDTEAQLRGVVPGPQPHGKQARLLTRGMLTVPGLTRGSWLGCRALGRNTFEVMEVEMQPVVLSVLFLKGGLTYCQIVENKECENTCFKCSEMTE